jgi:hypothetical protein
MPRERHTEKWMEGLQIWNVIISLQYVFFIALIYTFLSFLKQFLLHLLMDTPDVDLSGSSNP